MKEQILELLPILREHKKLILQMAALLVLFIAVISLTSHLTLSYQEQAEKEHQIATMQNYLKDWQSKNDELNAATMRPVEANQVDQVQTDIMLRVQSTNCNLLSMKDSPKTEQNGKVTTIEFSGSYENTMRCLQSFHAKDALIGIKSMKMEQKNGALDTTLTYKIYTK